jgi:hypothetical protein
MEHPHLQISKVCAHRLGKDNAVTMSAPQTVEVTLSSVDLTSTVIYSFRPARVGHKADFAYAVVSEPDGTSNGVTMEVSGVSKPTLQSVPQMSEFATSSGLSRHDVLHSARTLATTLTEQYSTWYKAEKVHPRRSRQRGRIDAIAQSLRDSTGTRFGMVELQDITSLDDQGVYRSNRPIPSPMGSILCWAQDTAEDGIPHFRVAYGVTLSEPLTNENDGQTILLDAFRIVCLLSHGCVHVQQRHQEWLDTVAVGSEMAKELSHFIDTKVDSLRKESKTTGRARNDLSTVVRSFRPSASRCLVTELPKRDFNNFESKWLIHLCPSAEESDASAAGAAAAQIRQQMGSVWSDDSSACTIWIGTQEGRF